MGSVPNFCSQCGASLSPGDAFCSQCGTSVGNDGTGVGDDGTGVGNDGIGVGRRGESERGAFGVDRRSAPDRDESGVGAADGRAPGGRSAFRRRVRDLTVEGWQVEHDDGDRVVLVDRGFGSAAVHLLLFLFTLGFVNLLYAAYSYTLGADRVELRADGTERSLSGRDARAAGRNERADDGRGHDGRAVDGEGTVGTPGSVVGAAFCALLGFAVLGSATDVPGVFIGAIFLLLALYSFPPVRARLRERESVTTFGWARSTDEWVVDAPDTPCNVCSRLIGTGVARTYHETLYVAGFPVVRDEQGTNGYCRSCAQGDPFADSDAGASDRDRETVRE